MPGLHLRQEHTLNFPVVKPIQQNRQIRSQDNKQDVFHLQSDHRVSRP